MVSTRLTRAPVAAAVAGAFGTQPGEIEERVLYRNGKRLASAMLKINRGKN